MTFDERTIIAPVVAYGWEMRTYNFVFLKIRWEGDSVWHIREEKCVKNIVWEAWMKETTCKT